MKKGNKKSLISLIIFGILLILFYLLPVKNILTTDMSCTFLAPSTLHPFGTDNLGRDVYSLIITGGRRTMEVVFIATSISFVFGSFLGMLEGFTGRIGSAIIEFIADFTLIIPSFILAMVVSAIFGFSPIMAGIVFGIGNMGQYINQAFDLTMGLKNLDFIEAEKIIGANNCRIIFLHVFPNIYRQLLIFMGNKITTVIIQYSGLAFIGLGTDVTSPDWGTLLYNYRVYLISHPSLVLYPTFAIMTLTLLFHYMFDNGKGTGDSY